MTETEIIQELTNFSPDSSDKKGAARRLDLIAQAMALGYGIPRLSRIMNISKTATRRLMLIVRKREDAHFGL